MLQLQFIFIHHALVTFLHTHLTKSFGLSSLIKYVENIRKENFIEYCQMIENEFLSLMRHNLIACLVSPLLLHDIKPSLSLWVNFKIRSISVHELFLLIIRISEKFQLH
ncbi:CLUMA_CG005497, isoform A [Clunio marinus]|uniref:CLUMA_CG005497, isoform A n=1 Tax=Clunio marinus TaxID=568069 RepID=A0A1J1HWZ1_9DIPT|nr:CLUMA_CG005497, isoform A [Clunio marinus]